MIRRQLGRTLIAAATAALLAVLLATPAQARNFFGLVADANRLGAGDFAGIRQARVDAARVLINWRAVELTDDAFNWASVDRQIGAFAAEGIQPVPVLFENRFGSNPVKPPVGSAKQKREWKEFVGEAVKRYKKGGAYWGGIYQSQFPGGKPKRIKDWQVWNEPNGPKHFSPRPNVKKYAKLLKLSNSAIRKQDRRADVLMAGLAAKPTGKGGIKAWTYIAKLLKIKRAKRTFDHVALHPYAPNVKDVGKSMRKIRKALKRGGKKKAEAWVTEFGWSSNPKVKGKLGKSPKQQAKLLKGTYTLLKKKRKAWRVGGAYWFTWRDDPALLGVCDWCSTAGLVDENLNPKPAFNAYKKVAR